MTYRNTLKPSISSFRIFQNFMFETVAQTCRKFPNAHLHGMGADASDESCGSVPWESMVYRTALGTRKKHMISD